MTSETLGGPQRHALPALRYRLPVLETAPRDRSRTPAGLVAGLTMFAVAIWLVVRNDMFRAAEARAVTPIAAFVVGGRVDRTHDIVFFGLGTTRRFGLHLTDECTSALLLIPLLVMMGFFAIFARMSLGRQLVAVLSGALLILVVNFARITGIAYATWQWGFHPGYEYSHVFIGSAFSLLGFVGAILLALWILVRGDRPVAVAAARAGAAVTSPTTTGDPFTTARDPAVHDPATTEGMAMTPTADPDLLADATRAELMALRAEFERDLTHLRDRFDRHLLAARQAARDAELRAADAETRAQDAERELAAARRPSPIPARSADAPRASSAPTAPADTTGPAGRSDLPTPQELKAVLADVQRRIDELAQRTVR